MYTDEQGVDRGNLSICAQKKGSREYKRARSMP